jgi:hypothetical protein
MLNCYHLGSGCRDVRCIHAHELSGVDLEVVTDINYAGLDEFEEYPLFQLDSNEGRKRRLCALAIRALYVGRQIRPNTMTGWWMIVHRPVVCPRRVASL